MKHDNIFWMLISSKEPVGGCKVHTLVTDGQCHLLDGFFSVPRLSCLLFPLQVQVLAVDINLPSQSCSLGRLGLQERKHPASPPKESAAGDES
jgi:hypothetical protein